jgi:hypothetical protein
MHHEAIFEGVASVNKPRLPIDLLHQQLLETIGWISSDALELLTCVDRFSDVFDRSGKARIEASIKARFRIS